MSSIVHPPRIGVNAALVRDNHILLVEFDDASGIHYNLPGGGVQAGESVHDALHRELREETCCSVDIHRLLLVWEYFPPQHHHRYGSTHKVGLIFLCSLADGSAEARLPEQPDPHQTAVRWIPLDRLCDIPLLPACASHLLRALEQRLPNTFLET